MQCPKCKKETSSDVECESCGIIFDKYQKRVETSNTMQQTEQYNQKEPWLAVLLSSLWTGVGQIYGGNKQRGVFFIIADFIIYLLIIVNVRRFVILQDAGASRLSAFIAIISVFILIIFSIYVLFDAYKIAKYYNLQQNSTVVKDVIKKPWLAAFLSNIFPGIGQFYNRQILKGVILLTIAMTLFAAEKWNYFIILLMFPVGFFALKDAFDSAAKINSADNRFLKQKRILVIFIVIMTFLNAIPFSKIIGNNIKNYDLEAFNIPSGSMYPTLRIGDRVFVSKLKSSNYSGNRGDIVVFKNPEDPKKLFIKRVIGIEGDKIQIIKGHLYINEQYILTTSINSSAIEKPGTDGNKPTLYEEQLGNIKYSIQFLHDPSYNDFGPVLVPRDSVFVLGDNRDNSKDSRHFGFIQKENIVGKAFKIYWSWDHAERRVIWDRIGSKII